MWFFTARCPRCPWQLNWLTCRAAASTCSSDWTWWGTLQTGHGFPKKVPLKRTWAWCVWIALHMLHSGVWLKSWVSRSISMKFHSAFGIAELKNLPFFKSFFQVALGKTFNSSSPLPEESLPSQFCRGLGNFQLLQVWVSETTGYVASLVWRSVERIHGQEIFNEGLTFYSQ